jgi:DnaJ-class molecular chaperone
MRNEHKAHMAWEEARALLGVGPDADDAQLRSAYLQKVQQHPPDRAPEMFERIRDAYEQLKNPAIRAKQVLGGPDPMAPLANLFAGLQTRRRFVGPQPWLDALKEAKEKST